MTTQATPNIVIAQTGDEDIYCFIMVITTLEGELTLRFHALELVGLVQGIQLELLSWFADSAINTLEMLGRTEEAELLRKMRDETAT